MQRVLVIGPGGAGKSRLAQRLAALTGLPLIYLDMPPLLCLWRVLERRLANSGRVREGMAEGCIEKLDAKFLWWILSFRAVRRAPILARPARLRTDQRAVTCDGHANWKPSWRRPAEPGSARHHFVGRALVDDMIVPAADVAHGALVAQRRDFGPRAHLGALAAIPGAFARAAGRR